MSKKTLNKANVEKLGADKLAALMTELVHGNAALQRRARMELSAAQGPKDVAADPAATVACTPYLRHAPAFARNRAPIAAAIAEVLPATPCTVLEIAAGTGEHALWMARCSLPQVTWQPSEATQEGLAGIEDWRALCPDLADRVLPSVRIDAARPPCPGPAVDVIFTANLTHIAPWAATNGLIAGGRRAAGAGGLLLIYGPFNEHDTFTGPGNAAFDADRRRRPRIHARNHPA